MVCDKRLVFLTCYSNTGRFNRYVYYLVNELKKISSKIVIIVNGSIDSIDRSKFEQLGVSIVVRENKGLDMAAWKYAIADIISNGNINQYDELILSNDTYYGPFYSFDTVFSTMKAIDVDFWGITSHGKIPNIWGVSSDEYFENHIQSYFVVIRNRMLHSDHFARYWNEMKIYDTFEEVVSYCEVKFTKYFESLGYSWTTYLNVKRKTNNHCSYNEYINDPYGLLLDGCPILKRKSCYDIGQYLHFNNGDEVRKSLDYIKYNTKYDVSMILEDLISKMDYYDLYKNLGLSYIIDSHGHTSTIIDLKKISIVLLISNIDNFDLFKEKVIEYSGSFNILILTISSEITNSIKEQLGIISNCCIKQVLYQNDPVKTMMLNSVGYITDYVYVCFIHDVVPEVHFEITEREWISRRIENAIASISFIKEVVSIFEHDSVVGLLQPPKSRFGLDMGEQTNNDFDDSMIKKCKESGLNIRTGKMNNALVSSSFWIRVKSASQLFSNNQSNLSKQDIDISECDETSVKSLIPHLVHGNGYYIGTAMEKKYAEMEYVRSNHITLDISKHFIGSLNNTTYTYFQLSQLVDEIGNKIIELERNNQELERNNQDLSASNQELEINNINLEMKYKVEIEKNYELENSIWKAIKNVGCSIIRKIKL